MTRTTATGRTYGPDELDPDELDPAFEADGNANVLLQRDAAL